MNNVHLNPGKTPEYRASQGIAAGLEYTNTQYVELLPPDDHHA
jgi:hypothetical protein